MTTRFMNGAMMTATSINLHRVELTAANSVASAWWELPASTGIYLFALRNGSHHLRNWGYYEVSRKRPTTLRDSVLVWVGKAASDGGIQGRVVDHLFGDARKSSFRQTCGALMMRDLGLRPRIKYGHSQFHFGSDEPILSEWLFENLFVGFQPIENARVEEIKLIRRWRPVLNIKEQEALPFAQRLLRLRFGISQGEDE